MFHFEFLVFSYRPQFATTAIPSPLTSHELDSLGYGTTCTVKIEIYEQNGIPFDDCLPVSLTRHLWRALGQNKNNILSFKSTRIPGQSLRINYQLKKPVHLPHISRNEKFDFYEILPDICFGLDIKPRVYKALLLELDEQ